MTNQDFLRAQFLLFKKQLASTPPLPINNNIIIFNSITNKWELGVQAGGGQDNTSSNVGIGAGLALPKVGVDLPFKSVLAGAGITINVLANEIQIVNTGVTVSDLELIKDETLGADTDDWNITGIPTREFLFIFLHLNESSGGSINIELFFNNNSGAIYAYRRNENFGTITEEIDDTKIEIDAGSNNADMFHKMVISNLSGRNKLLTVDSVGDDGGGAGIVPETSTVFCKVVLTDQIDEINLHNTGTGDIASGSRILVYASKT